MIVIRDIYKYYKEQIALRGVSCVFEEGNIYGIYGESGSGKTILLQLILGFSVPNNGSISVNGKILHKDMPFTENTGYSIGDMELIPHYDCFENIRQLGMVHHKVTDEEINLTLDRVGLASSLKVQDYTQDMKQRLKLAQAICQQPDIILLDEPAIGLKPEGKKRFWNIVQQEKERGAIVIIAMREPEELRQHCDEIYELKEGVLQQKVSIPE